jgi:hypothetical protein
LYTGRCTATSPSGCPAGALTAKADPAWALDATTGTLDVVYVDRQLSLVDVSGRAVVVRVAATGAAVACATLQPYTVSGTTVLQAEEPYVISPPPFFSTAAGGIAILAIVLLCLLVVGGIAVLVLRQYNFGWLPDRFRSGPPARVVASGRRSSGTTDESTSSTSDLFNSSGRRGQHEASGAWTISPLTSGS